MKYIITESQMTKIVRILKEDKDYDIDDESKSEVSSEVLKKDIDSESDKPKDIESILWPIYTSDEYVIIKSPSYKGKKVHVLFGGLHTNLTYSSKGGADLNAMKKYVKYLEPYSSNAIIAITHHMNTLGNAEEYMKKKFGATVTSIAGFSQGGKETWKHKDDSSLSLVGLIDPSTYETGLSLGDNTVLYCDPKNWGTDGFNGQTRKRLEWYCEHKNEYNGKVVCFNKGGTHMNFAILKSFYEKYGSRI